MRRAIVVLLILLFPLHVFALSCSDTSVTNAAVDDTISFSLGDAASGDGNGQLPDDEIDPDEPPSGADNHEWVQAAGRLPPAVTLEAMSPSLTRLHQGLAPLPPLKPPPVR